MTTKKIIIVLILFNIGYWSYQYFTRPLTSIPSLQRVPTVSFISPALAAKPYDVKIHTIEHRGQPNLATLWSARKSILSLYQKLLSTSVGQYRPIISLAIDESLPWEPLTSVEVVVKKSPDPCVHPKPSKTLFVQENLINPLILAYPYFHYISNKQLNDGKRPSEQKVPLEISTIKYNLRELKADIQVLGPFLPICDEFNQDEYSKPKLSISLINAFDFGFKYAKASVKNFGRPDFEPLQQTPQ